MQPDHEGGLAALQTHVHPARGSGATAVVLHSALACVFQPSPPLSPLLCRVLLRRMLAALAASTVTIITAIVGVAAVAVSTTIDASFLFIVFGGLRRVAASDSDAAQAT